MISNDVLSKSVFMKPEAPIIRLFCCMILFYWGFSLFTKSFDFIFEVIITGVLIIESYVILKHSKKAASMQLEKLKEAIQQQNGIPVTVKSGNFNEFINTLISGHNFRTAHDKHGRKYRVEYYGEKEEFEGFVFDMYPTHLGRARYTVISKQDFKSEHELKSQTSITSKDYQAASDSVFRFSVKHLRHGALVILLGLLSLLLLVFYKNIDVFYVIGAMVLHLNVMKKYQENTLQSFTEIRKLVSQNNNSHYPTVKVLSAPQWEDVFGRRFREAICADGSKITIQYYGYEKEFEAYYITFNRSFWFIGQRSFVVPLYYFTNYKKAV